MCMCACVCVCVCVCACVCVCVRVGVCACDPDSEIWSAANEEVGVWAGVVCKFKYSVSLPNTRRAGL